MVSEGGGMFVDAGETFALGAPDRRLFVEFDMKACLDEEASKEAGRPIFRDKEYVRIIIPGDRLANVHKEVTPAIRAQYADQYQAWKTGGDQHATTGTPLSVWAWPGITRSTVEELKYFRCYTVEQLAGLQDGVLSRLGPGYLKLREEARAWLKSAETSAPLSKLQGENDELKARLASAEAMLKEQGATLARLDARRGKAKSDGAEAAA